MRIGLDAMGGDFSPSECLIGAAKFKADFPKHQITLFGDKNLIDQKSLELSIDLNLFEIVDCKEHIAMNEHGARAVAAKKESSISVGMQYHALGKTDCFISAGNTGAMLAASVFILKTIPGVLRPTINSVLPRPGEINGLILDVGANADCKPEYLAQFGLLGSIYVKEVYNIKNPRVALLNIGEEKGKGNLLAQQAYELLEQAPNINFVGNIEGRNLFNDKIADVVVCDGFTGNTVLKTAEGLFYQIAKSGIQSDFLDKFNFNNYGGVPILGVNGNVIIGHGISKAATFYQMIKLGESIVELEIVKKIKSAL